MTADLNVEFTCLPPDKAVAADEAAFKKFVIDAREVNPKTLPTLYAKALVLCFARVDGDLAAVGAIKRPFHNHRDRVFAAAKSKESPLAFIYELGWFHVLKEYRGHKISSRMVAQLVPWTEGDTVYATSRINNLPMHAALTKHGGFIPEGSDYPSSEGEVPLRLFIKR